MFGIFGYFSDWRENIMLNVYLVSQRYPSERHYLSLVSKYSDDSSGDF